MTTSDELVKTVAKAIFRKLGDMGDDLVDFYPAARAALEASGIERIQEEARKLREALRTTDEYHLTGLKFRNGQCSYATLNTAALAKEDARTALSADMGEDHSG